MDLYGADLAYIHDDGFGHVAQGAAQVLLHALGAAGLPAGAHVVDLGCGSGTLAALLAASGCAVTGVDQSAAMLGLAQSAAPAAQFVNDTLWHYALPPCAAVSATGEALNYYTGAPPTDGALAGLLARIHAALIPGGLLLFDCAGPGRAAPGGGRFFREGADWACGGEAREDAAGLTLEREIVLFRREPQGTLYRRHSETHRLRLWPPELVARLLAEAGFSAELLPAYGGVQLPAGMAVWLARKSR